MLLELPTLEKPTKREPSTASVSRVAGDRTPGALALMQPGRDCEMLEETFHEAGWELVVADSLASALAEQRSRPFPIILCEREWTECDWHRAVAVLSGLPPRPWLILVSERSDRNLWDELTWLGGSDILRTPLGRDTVIRAIRSGWLLWKHMRELRRATRNGA